MSDEWGKWLRPGSFIAAALCLLLAGHKFFVSGPTTNQVEIIEETPYQYQLKKNKQVIKSYRNPAALKKAEVPAESRSFEVRNQNKDGESYSNDNFSTENQPSSAGTTISSSAAVGNGNSHDYSNSRSRNHSESAPSQSTSSSTPNSSNTGGVIAGGGSLLPPNGTSTDTGSKSSSNDDQKEDQPIPRLFGKVVPLSGKITHNSNNPFISSAYAVGTCTDPRILLFDLIDMSVLLDNPISEDIIRGEASFEFDPIELKLNIKTPTRYLLHTKGCTENYQRIVTSFYTPQDLDFITSVIAQIINSENSESVINVRSDNLDKLYREITKNTEDPRNYDSILDTVSDSTDVGSYLQQAFQGSTTESIINAAPVINDVTITSPLKEKVAKTFSVNAEHWNNEYQIAYEWQLDGVTVSTSPNWIFTPGANSPANHKITLLTGKKATTGNTIDRNFAYHETSWDIDVEDTHPSLAPVVSFHSSVLNPTKTKSIKLELQTGTACETFSSFAITENNQTLDTATFSHICEAPSPQIINYNVQAVTDGTRILKFWSKDVEGRISVTPLELSLTVDTTFPQITFNPLPASYASDEYHLIEWTLSEAHSSSSQNFLFELFDGTSWVSLGNVPLLNGPHTGTPFSGNLHFPNQQILGAKLRITYADLLGQETIQESLPFNIYRPELGSSPTIIDLGSTLNLSTSALTAFSITNTGLVPSKLCNSPVINGVNASEFTIVSDGCALTNIPAGGSCPMTIHGSPMAKGTRNGILTITCGNDTYSTGLTLESLNNAPVTADQGVTTLEDNSLSIVLGPINDSDGDSLTYTVPASSSNGTINNCLIAGSFYRCDYTPSLDFNGTDSFTFYSSDGIVDSNISTATITVLAVNDEPVLSGVLSLTTPEDTPLLFDLVAGTDVDLDTLHYEIITPPTHGTLVCPLDTSTSCTYTPDLNYFGSDTFTYRVKDGSLDSLNSITATITVTAVNDAPTLAADQSFYTRDNQDFNFTINSGSDVDHLTSELSYKLVTDPAAGTLSGCLNTSSYSTDLTCTYKSPVHYHGPITITYLVYDGDLDSVSVATITIDVEDKTPTIPQLTPVNFTPTVSTTLSSLTLTSPNCNDISYVMIQESATSPTPADSGWQSCTTVVGALTFDPSITSQQGFRTLRIYGRDHNDNISSAQLVNFIYDTMAPQITIENIPTLPNGISYPIKWRLTEASVNAASTFKIEYSINNGTNWTVASNMPVGQNGPHASTLFTYNWPVVNGTYPNSLFRITLVDNNGMSGTATSNIFRILVDVTAPNLLSGGMKINGSTTPPPTPQKYVDVSLSAIDDDTNITHFCFKNGNTQPTANHSCWRAVDAPQPGLAPSTTLNLANFPYLLSFVPGTFNVYAWIKDLSGNISTNTGTVGTDVVSITYFGDYSPVISNFFVSNTLTPPNPIVADQMEFLENDSVYIKWTATDDKGLLPTIRLSYTTDDINYYDIATNLNNGLNNCSSLNEGGTSLDDNSTGCYNWVTPANLDNTYFRIQLIVEDNANQATSILSLPLNSTRFKILAGNIDPGVGSHAKSAIITTPGVPALYSLAVASDGKVFIRDAQFGLMYINPQTGIYEQLLTVTGVSTGDNGPVRSASATKIYKITMDYQDRLIIWDYDRIRRVDTKTEPMMIETIIGAYNNGAAGTETTDIVTSPADLKIHPEPAASVLLQPLPNGDIYFQAGPWGTVNDGNTLRVYRGSLPAPTVTSIYVSGNGPLDYKGELLSLTEDTVTSYLIQFNSQTSAIEKMVTQLLEYPSGCSYYAFINVDINSFVSAPPHPPVHVSTCGDAFVRTGLDGKIYNIGYHVAYTVKVSRYNSVTNAHDMIIGSGQGYCADNTSATACRTYLSDVFVTPQGKVFFIDNGLVRVIDDSGNVQTLYGQTKTYGDNGLAQDARFNNLTYIDHGVGDNVIVYDSAEKIIREIRPNEVSNQIVLLAGNGQSAAVDFNLPANSQTLNGANWQQPGTFVTNPADGTIYFACLWYQICKLNRATGKWEYHSGEPSTPVTAWTNTGALDATTMNYGAYAPTSLAFYNGKMITGHYSYNSTFRTSQNSTLRELNVTTKVSTFLAGKSEVDGQGVCPDGAGNNCNLGSARSQGRALTYHTPSGSWLYEQLNNEIKLVKVSGAVGSISLFDVISDGVQSMVWNGDTLYYCNNNGELKKRNYTTSIETVLAFPGSGIKCYGAKMLWKNASGDKPNRLVFPFTQNGLSGIAEYLSP